MYALFYDKFTLLKTKKIGKCRGIRVEEVDEVGNENNKSPDM